MQCAAWPHRGAHARSNTAYIGLAGSNRIMSPVGVRLSCIYSRQRCSACERISSNDGRRAGARPRPRVLESRAGGVPCHACILYEGRLIAESRSSPTNINPTRATRC